MNYKPVIGLEVHVELKTKSKMFCGCLADHFAKKPNTQVCPVCLGLPGALPVPNAKAIEWCVLIGLALNCEIPLFSKFDRKNYFYPDLAKGYQISQYDQPFCKNGFIHLAGVATQHLQCVQLDSSEVDTHRKTIRIRRVHMEEDTAKLMHQFGIQNYEEQKKFTLIDFNRSGVPLVEIVTEPDFTTALEVKEYLQKLQQIVRYLGVAEADMEKGQMRLEPNISLLVHTSGESLCNTSEVACKDSSEVNLPSYKVEVKNINSFRFVEKAVNYEIERQIKILQAGKTPSQETRGWDEKKGITVAQRTKEEAKDYRYFPEPDIPSIRWSNSQITILKSKMTELPDSKLERFKKEYRLSQYDAEILTREKQAADYFEEAVKINEKLRINQSDEEKPIKIKDIANWVINKKPDIEKLLPAGLIQIILSSKKTVAVDESQLEKAIDQVIEENKKAVEDYKKGKENVIMYLIGQVMKKINIKIDASIIKKKIESRLR